MSDNSAPTNGEKSEPNKPYEATKPRVKWTWWKTTALIVIGIASIGLLIYSSINYEDARKYSPYIQWPAPPTYTGEAPLHIDSMQEARDSHNNLILVITQSNDVVLNDSVTAVTVEAANRIRSSDKIYVGVFVLSQDDSLSYPTVRLILYTEAASTLPVTMRENITKDLIYNNYIDRKYLR